LAMSEKLRDYPCPCKQRRSGDDSGKKIRLLSVAFREDETEPAAFSGFAFHPDLAAVLLDDGGRVFLHGAADRIQSAAQWLQQAWGGVDVVVNNAGITRDTLAMRMKDDDWDAVIDTNLKAVFRLSRAVIKPMMKQRQGRIINITSVVGASGNPGQANYAAAKAGVAGMTRALAREIGSRGITVNCVAPGFVETDMTKALDDKQTAALLANIPLGRLGKPEDIAAAVTFLASAAAGYITGTTVHVNGGMYMS